MPKDRKCRREVCFGETPRLASHSVPEVLLKMRHASLSNDIVEPRRQRLGGANTLRREHDKQADPAPVELQQDSWPSRGSMLIASRRASFSRFRCGPHSDSCC